MTAITIYLNRNDPKDIQIKDSDGAVDLITITRVDLIKEGCSLIISSTSPEESGMFDWTIGNGVLRLELGALDIDPGTYTFTLMLYSAEWPLGIPWNKLTISFVDICPSV